jgi:hypothetical protein
VKSRTRHRRRMPADLDRELVAAARMAISDRRLVGPNPDVAERRKGCVVEGGGTAQVRDCKGTWCSMAQLQNAHVFEPDPLHRLSGRHLPGGLRTRRVASVLHPLVEQPAVGGSITW